VIADIALQVGFSSQSHLTQQLKRFTGMTPKQVRALSTKYHKNLKAVEH
jgi:AraC family transcriptional regulator